MKILKTLSFSIILLLSTFTSLGQTAMQDTVLAKAYYKLGDKHYDNNNLDSSNYYYQKTADIYKNIAQKNNDKLMWAKYIKLMYYVSLNLTSQNKFDKSINILDSALSVCKKYLGEKHKQLASIYSGYGEVYHRTDKYDLSLQYYFKALKIRKALFGEKHADVAKNYSNIAVVYDLKDEYDLALEYHLKSLQIMKELLGEKHINVATIYNNIGVVNHNKGDYDLALKYYFKSLKIRKEQYGKKHASVAISYYNIGSIYSERSEYNLALQYLLKSIQIYKDIFGEKHIEISNSYTNIGNVYNEKGEYDLALQYFFTSLQIDKGFYGEKHIDVAINYHNIGLVYENKSEYDLAIQYYFKALQIFKEQLGEQHVYVSYSYNTIGTSYDSKSEYNLALQYYLKSLKILKEQYGEKHADVAINYNNIGVVYYKKGEYDLALQYHLKALYIRKELLNEKHIDMAMSYTNIGTTYYSKDEHNLALQYFFKSLRIYNEIFGEKHADVVMNYNNIGNIYKDKNKYKQALNYYQKATASNLRNFNDTLNIYPIPEVKDYLSWEYLLQSLKAKAKIFANNYNKQSLALQHYQACDTLITQVRKEIQTKPDKLTLGEKASEVYKSAVGLCKNLSKSCRADSVSYYKQLAFNCSEKDKTRVLLNEIAEKNAMQKSSIPKKLIEKEKDLRFYASFYKNKIEEAEDKEKKELESKLFDTNREHEKLIEKFKTEYPKFAELKYNTKVSKIENIQSILNENTAIRSYTIGDSLIYIFTITQNNFSIDTISKAKDFNNNIKEYRSLLNNSAKIMNTKFAKQSYILHNQLFPSHAKINDNVENLVIIPDDSLSLISFEALLFKEHKGDVNNLSKYPFLIKKYAITYAPSVSLYYNKKSSRYKAPEKNIAIFAPVFKGNNSIIIDESEGEIEQEYYRSSLGNMGYANPDGSIKPLAYTEDEAKQIKNIFKKKSLALIHKGATENYAKSDIMKDYKIIHFATHGSSNTDKPHLSGVVLAQDTTQGEDGFLHSNEIYGLNWNTDLVTLSACQTAKGKIQNGEGVMDLSRAFFYAGTNNVLATLWSVQDKSTAELMILFYKYYHKKGMSFSKALQKAKLDMIASKNKLYRHPKHWAAFLLIGRN